ncbi:hypothetical protein XELAEV_18007296mg [Xenopus laevis]|uniref:Immunoglobulin C1-set domain-containing protein n=1 Tax=Xenopus laevis TaxID=8355 RepID=A0A974E1H2_XENLA|nr:hypothetical protein XELAEV_18007296mg [Xenopus laevis]
MAFGRGTELTVEPGEMPPTVPSVFVLKPLEAGSPTACLMKDFFPKDVVIYMNSTQSNSGNINTTSIVSLNGKYNAVHVGSLGTETLQCQAKHQGNWFRDIDTFLEAKETIPEPTDQTPDAAPHENTQTERCDPPATDTHAQSSEIINILSVTVLGMRLLFINIGYQLTSKH